jgi:hypothetical protein
MVSVEYTVEDDWAIATDVIIVTNVTAKIGFISFLLVGPILARVDNTARTPWFTSQAVGVSSVWIRRVSRPSMMRRAR